MISTATTFEEKQRERMIELLQNLDFHLQDLVKSIDKLVKKVSEIP